MQLFQGYYFFYPIISAMERNLIRNDSQNSLQKFPKKNFYLNVTYSYDGLINKTVVFQFGLSAVFC